MNDHARRELEMDPRALPLVRGNFGHHVRQVQEWLSLHGFHTAVDGDFGPATEAALKAFQDHMDRAYSPEQVAFGMVDAETWSALTESMRDVVEWKRQPWPTRPVGDSIVDCARAHLAATPREVGKPNGGPWVRYYCRGQEVPWCAGFATTVLSQALGHDDWYTLSCDELAEKAKREARWVHVTSGASGVVKPGAVFLIRSFDGFNDWVHTGIVTAVHAEHFETIEGNTNTDGSREGTAVHARARAFRQNVDFVLTGDER